MENMEDKGIESLSDIEEVQGQTGSASEEKPSEKESAPSAGTGEEEGKTSPVVSLAVEMGALPSIDESSAIDFLRERINDLQEWKDSELNANQKLLDALNADPEFRDLIGYILQGASLAEAIARTIDIESLRPVEGSPDYTKWEAAKEARMKRLKEMDEEDARNKEMASMLEINRDALLAMVESFAERKGMDKDETLKLKVELARFAKDIMEFRVTEEVLDMIYKSDKMEEIINEAREEGAVEARNERIETMRMKRAENDGLPVLESSASGREGREADSVDDFFASLFKKHKIS